jgi:DNA-binding PadR family transcriptional regulator
MKNNDIVGQATKPIARLKRLLTYGNIWLYILSLLKDKGEVYAYVLDGEIEKEFLFRPNKIMLYIVLYKLEDEGLIKAKQKTGDRRKYYAITTKGQEALKLAKEYLNNLSMRL